MPEQITPLHTNPDVPQAPTRDLGPRTPAQRGPIAIPSIRAARQQAYQNISGVIQKAAGTVKVGDVAGNVTSGDVGTALQGVPPKPKPVEYTVQGPPLPTGGTAVLPDYQAIEAARVEATQKILEQYAVRNPDGSLKLDSSGQPIYNMTAEQQQAAIEQGYQQTVGQIPGAPQNYQQYTFSQEYQLGKGYTKPENLDPVVAARIGKVKPVDTTGMSPQESAQAGVQGKVIAPGVIQYGNNVDIFGSQFTLKTWESLSPQEREAIVSSASKGQSVDLTVKTINVVRQRAVDEANRAALLKTGEAQTAYLKTLSQPQRDAFSTALARYQSQGLSFNESFSKAAETVQLQDINTIIQNLTPSQIEVFKKAQSEAEAQGKSPMEALQIGAQAALQQVQNDFTINLQTVDPEGYSAYAKGFGDAYNKAVSEGKSKAEAQVIAVDAGNAAYGQYQQGIFEVLRQNNAIDENGNINFVKAVKVGVSPEKLIGIGIAKESVNAAKQVSQIAPDAIDSEGNINPILAIASGVSVDTLVQIGLKREQLAAIKTLFDNKLLSDAGTVDVFHAYGKVPDSVLIDAGVATQDTIESAKALQFYRLETPIFGPTKGGAPLYDAQFDLVGYRTANPSPEARQILINAGFDVKYIDQADAVVSARNTLKPYISPPPSQFGQQAIADYFKNPNYDLVKFLRDNPASVQTVINLNPTSPEWAANITKYSDAVKAMTSAGAWDAKGNIDLGKAPIDAVGVIGGMQTAIQAAFVQSTDANGNIDSNKLSQLLTVVSNQFPGQDIKPDVIQTYQQLTKLDTASKQIGYVGQQVEGGLQKILGVVSKAPPVVKQVGEFGVGLVESGTVSLIGLVGLGGAAFDIGSALKAGEYGTAGSVALSVPKGMFQFISGIPSKVAAQPYEGAGFLAGLVAIAAVSGGRGGTIAGQLREAATQLVKVGDIDAAGVALAKAGTELYKTTPLASVKPAVEFLLKPEGIAAEIAEAGKGNIGPLASRIPGSGLVKGVFHFINPIDMPGSVLGLTVDVGRSQIPSEMSPLAARELVAQVERLQLTGEIPARDIRALDKLTDVSNVTITRTPNGVPDIVLHSSDGGVVGHVAGMQRVVNDIVYHVAPDTDVLLSQVEKDGKFVVDPTKSKTGLMFFSQQPAQTFMSATGLPTKPGIIALRLGDIELKPPPKEVLDSPTLREMKLKMEELAREGKLEPGFYEIYKGYRPYPGGPMTTEYELVAAPGTEFYPAQPANYGALNPLLQKESYGRIPTTYVSSLLNYTSDNPLIANIKSGQMVPEYWMATREAASAGLGVPRVIQTYEGKLYGILTEMRKNMPWNIRLRPPATREGGATSGSPFSSALQQIEFKAQPTNYAAGRVTALIDNPKGEILLVRQLGQNRYDLPGGGVKGGVLSSETLDAALKREVYEELGLTAKDYQHVLEIESRFGKGSPSRTFQVYRVATEGKPIPASEIAEYKWWDGKSKLDYPIAEHVTDIISELNKQGNAVDIQAALKIVKGVEDSVKAEGLSGKKAEVEVSERLSNIIEEGERELLPYRYGTGVLRSMIDSRRDLGRPVSDIEGYYRSVAEPSRRAISIDRRGITLDQRRSAIARDREVVAERQPSVLEPTVTPEREPVTVEGTVAGREVLRTPTGRGIDGRPPVRPTVSRPDIPTGGRVVEPPRGGVREPPPPPPPVREPPPPTGRVRGGTQLDAARREQFRDSIAWKQGFGYWAIKAPYKTQDDVQFFYKNPPPGAKVVKGGVRSAYRSIQALTGLDVPVDLTLKLGIQNVRITSPGKEPGKSGGIEFIETEHNPEAAATGTDISLKLHEIPTSRRRSRYSSQYAPKKLVSTEAGRKFGSTFEDALTYEPTSEGQAQFIAKRVSEMLPSMTTEQIVSRLQALGLGVNDAQTQMVLSALPDKQRNMVATRLASGRMETQAAPFTIIKKTPTPEQVAQMQAEEDVVLGKVNVRQSKPIDILPAAQIVTLTGKGFKFN